MFLVLISRSVIVVPCSAHITTSMLVRLYDVASDVSRRHTLSANSCSCDSHNHSSSSSAVFPEPGVPAFIVDVLIRTRLHNSSFCLLMVFDNGLHLLQKEVSSMRGEEDMRTNI